MPKVRLISPEGKQIGIMSVENALRIAREMDLDLVEVAPEANPPVCKIMDYGKYRYELSKREKNIKKKQHVITIKEIRLRPKIEDHDFDFKLKHARKFLESGNKVKATVVFRGREMVHKELGVHILEKMAEELSDIARVEGELQSEGRNMIMYFVKK